MTDLTPYVRIVQRAERASRLPDPGQARAEIAKLLEELRALGPPEDPRARERIWAQFQAAENRVPTPSPPPRRRTPREVLQDRVTRTRRVAWRELALDAVRGYGRAFSFGESDSRSRFWPFALVGLPLGVLLIGAVSRIPVPSALVIMTVVALGAWWVLSLTAALWRRVDDAGTPTSLAIGAVLLPAALWFDAFVISFFLPPQPLAGVWPPAAPILIATTVLCGASTVANVVVACCLPAGRVRRWDHGGGMLVLAALAPVAVPALLFVVFFSVVFRLFTMGGQPRTTRVSSSRRRVRGRRASDGTWQKGRHVTVRSHERRLTGTRSSTSDEALSLSASGGAGLALRMVGAPGVIWDIALIPRARAAPMTNVTPTS